MRLLSSKSRPGAAALLVFCGIIMSVIPGNVRGENSFGAGARADSAAGDHVGDTKANPASPVFLPLFWDPGHLPEKPVVTEPETIRFLTESDNPPFHFMLEDGSLVGFDVDLARAVCAELQRTCTIQARPFDMLEPALAAHEGDVLLASLRVDRGLRPGLAFTAPYYTTPARFAARRGVRLDATPEGLAGKTIGVEGKTVHEAYLTAFFPDVVRKSFPTLALAQEALRKGEIDALFGDGILLALWLNGTDSEECCQFQGGPYTESAYFGEGIGMALREEDQDLRRLLDYGLARVAEKGGYAELYLKYFPLGFY